jgi:hypothetical protein
MTLFEYILKTNIIKITLKKKACENISSINRSVEQEVVLDSDCSSINPLFIIKLNLKLVQNTNYVQPLPPGPPNRRE